MQNRNNFSFPEKHLPQLRDFPKECWDGKFKKTRTVISLSIIVSRVKLQIVNILRT
jgi:hypothetical protein